MLEVITISALHELAVFKVNGYILHISVSLTDNVLNQKPKDFCVAKLLVFYVKCGINSLLRGSKRSILNFFDFHSGAEACG